MRGYTIAYCADAYATESGSADMHEEEKRKVRIAAGGLQSVWRLRTLLNPLRYGTFCFQYISHRVLRWSLTPVLLFSLLPLNTILIFTTDSPLFYAVIWLLQTLFYLMASWGYYLSKKRIKNKILFYSLLFPFYEYQRYTWLQLPVQTPGTDQWRMGKGTKSLTDRKMKNILKKAENAEKLLNLTSDTMILLDRDGVCVDIAVHNVNLWFLTEDQLLDKNLLQLLPPSTYRQIYPEFKKVLLRGEVSSRNYELATDSKTYFFKCIMRPYEDMVLCQYRDITERSQRKLELEKKNYELNEIQKVALIGRWWYDSGKECICYSGYSDITLDEEQQTVSLDSYITHILPEDREIFCKWLDENLQGDMKESVEYRIHFRQKVFYIRQKTFSCEKRPGGHTVLEGYIQNITDIQQRRNDITLLTHAINNATEDIFAAHEDGTLIFANRFFRQHHNIGLTDDITQLKIYQVNSHARSEEEWNRIKTSIPKGSQRKGFIFYDPLPLHPEVLAMEGNAFWVTSDEGEYSLWAFGKDITQRIKNEQQIKRFSQVLDKTIENLPAGIVVKDIKNNFKYLYRNRESYNRNIPMKEALGKDDFDFYPFDTAQKKRKQDMEIAETGIEKHWITEEYDQNGKSIILDKRKMRIKSKDFSPILLSIEWDITEMERMKQELLVAKEKSRGFRPIEVRLPCQHEPRNTHPAQCYCRLLQNHCRKHRCRRTEKLLRHCGSQQRTAAATNQRDSRPFQD